MQVSLKYSYCIVSTFTRIVIFKSGIKNTCIVYLGGNPYVCMRSTPLRLAATFSTFDLRILFAFRTFGAFLRLSGDRLTTTIYNYLPNAIQPQTFYGGV